MMIKINNDNLIFDLGFHNGDDTDYYLKKGFNVVAVEANPVLIEKGQEKFNVEIDAGQLILIHKAVSNIDEKIDFFIHPTNEDWSSCFKNIAQSDGSLSSAVSVDSVTVKKLFEQYGIPKYMKVDIEGCDLFVAKELSALPSKPKYVSFETNKREYAELFSYLHVAGYSSFQLVNQLNNPYRDTSMADREGAKITYYFSKYSSGLFGADLPENKWLSIDEALSRYVKYRELKIIDNQELGLGWIDLHARIGQ